MIMDLATAQTTIISQMDDVAASNCRFVPAGDGAETMCKSGWILRRINKPAVAIMIVKGIWNRMKVVSLIPQIVTANTTPGYNGHQHSQMCRNQKLIAESWPGRIFR